MYNFKNKIIDKLTGEYSDDSKIDFVRYYLGCRLTEEEFTELANMIKEIYIASKIRHLIIIKKLKEYGIEPDTLEPLPYEFRLWDTFKNGCDKSFTKCKVLYEDELDFINNLDVYSIDESTDIEELIPDGLKDVFNQVSQDNDSIGRVLRLYMEEKLRRLRLYKNGNENRLDKPYSGPTIQEDVIDEFNKIYTNEFGIPLDTEKENEKYHKMKFWFPELWQPIKFEPSDEDIAREMMNDPSFIYGLISIWTGFGNEFHYDYDYYGKRYIISDEYNWLINREKSKEEPDEKKIEQLQIDMAYHCKRLMSPILLNYYPYEVIKRTAYEMYRQIQASRDSYQQSQSETVLIKK